VAGNAKASGQQINVAKSAQLPVMGEVKKIIGTDIKNSFGNLVNGFSIEVRRGEIEKIKNLPGVKNVTEVKKYYVDMNSAKELTQAENVWKDYGYQGEGMLISIIDTGIDHTHKDMRLDQDGKDKAKLSKSAVEEKIKTLGKGTYLSEKVPFGYNYADKNNTAKDSTDSMHGMHVAGIAAANGSDEEIKAGSAVDGVAPDAQLLAMKVFSNGPLSSGAYSDDIVAAIEDSVTLGADVINMSL
jgi:lactocepin